MGWDDVEKLWDDSDDKYKVSSTYKERFEDTEKNVDKYYGHTDKHGDNVDYEYTDRYAEKRN